ncbi:hypothetical protein J2X11_001298 [Aeromicrobium panaciterrae]|uniref:DUF3592 domain-containing protein n=1 Tax=Aeromicrobium panaciterrae TaxID=363861 RepID=A0ABU1UMP8_9ACTN|nr:hypothetical protein [Aeromicrobium panaciterrae]MDR7086459.1 hypothetical protein [Aeromicrobium panaciterrae]
MRTRLSWVLTGLGALFGVVGLALILILGTDGRFSTGPHAVETDGIAVVTAPKVISWADLQVDVLAEVPAQKPVFVGIGNTVDVENYVGETARLEVTGFHTPWRPKTRQVAGRPGLPGAPTALDWWRAASAGRGGATISTNLPDETVSLAILSVGDSNLSGLKVSIAYGVKGGFFKGIGLLMLGAGAILLSRLLRRGEDIWAHDEDDEEDVVYVFIDDDGVEHEISAEEAEDYEVVEVEEVVVDDAAPEAVKESEPLAAPAPKPAGRFASRLNALKSTVGSTFERQPKPEPDSTASDDEELVYIFVDEYGVEHEISADEAANYEFIDEVVVEVDDKVDDEVDEKDDVKVEPPAPAPKERVMYVFVDEDGVEHEVSEDELADFEVIDEEEDKP